MAVRFVVSCGPGHEGDAWAREGILRAILRKHLHLNDVA